MEVKPPTSRHYSTYAWNFLNSVWCEPSPFIFWCDNGNGDAAERKGEVCNVEPNESTLAELKQKVVSVALWEQKLTTFEELYNEATPEERKDLLQVHINHLIYTPDGIQLALFDW